MKTHLISSSDGLWEEVDQLTYDSYIYNRLFKRLVELSGKSHNCITLLKEYAIKFGIDYFKYNINNRQKLKDINLFLEQCNEAYILRRHHFSEEMQYLEQKYKKE